jgi:hypothetical protein
MNTITGIDEAKRKAELGRIKKAFSFAILVVIQKKT